jgi:23S rRNA pseudouridine1911/1915/1917 synthase
MKILYLDNHLLAVNKPAGVPVQEDSSGDDDLLNQGKRWLKQRFDKPGNVFLGLVHRLDRPVSGVVVLARTSKSAARLSDQFRRRSPIKRYLAVVEGRAVGEQRLEDWLLKKDQKVRIVSASTPGAMQARLSWKALQSGKNLSLLEVSLETGRPHQIRVQLAKAGYPIKGDLRYGASTELDGRNLALHCVSLGVEHPTTQKPMLWTARPPETWDGLFDPSCWASLLEGATPMPSREEPS